MKRVLLLFSGGFDSTAALIYLLTETKFKIDVLHLCPLTPLGGIESSVCQKIKQYCRKHYRPFRYYQKNVERNPGVVGMPITRVAAAKWCNEKYQKKGLIYKYVIFGRIKLDFRGIFYQRSASAQSEWNRAIMPRIAKKTTFYFPLRKWSKQKVIEYIPKEILNEVWSCQNPKIHPNPRYFKKPKTCGKCSSCKDMKNLLTKNVNLQKIYPNLVTKYQLRISN